MILNHMYQMLTSTGFVSWSLAFDVSVMLVIIHISLAYLRPILFSYKQAKQLDKIARSPARHWFYGSIPKLGNTSNERMQKIASLTSSFPTMMNLWLGPIDSTLLFYFKDTAMALLSSGAPKDEFLYRYIRPWVGNGLLTSNGKMWQRNRRLLTPAFHFNILKPYTDVYNNCCKVMLDKWKTTLNQPKEISEDVSLMTLDTLLQCAMSSTTDCQHLRGEHAYITAIQELGRCARHRFLNPLFIFDIIFNLSSVGRRYKHAVKIVHEQAEQIIAARREVLKNEILNEDSTALNGNNFKSGGKILLDFLDILLQTRDEDGKGLSSREIRDEVDTFLFEGHDTTASGISWSLYNLAKYPELQQKCRKEIFDVVGEKENVEWSDLSKLHYLTMFIKEDLRLFPPVPSIGRCLEKPLKIHSDFINPSDVTIPQGSKAWLSIFSLHRNAQEWENPTKFDPERFTKERSMTRNAHAYLPFSAGSRNCIGQNFAMNEMKVVLAQTLRRYELYLDGETPEPILDARIVLHSSKGIVIKLKLIQQ